MKEKQYIGFMLGKELYGIEITVVKTIERMMTITSIPKAQAYVEGVVNFRGEVIPVINLSKVLEIKANTNEDARILFVELKNVLVGLMVDLVTEVIKVDESVIDNVPSITKEGDFMEGIAKLEDKLMILLNPSKLFSSMDIQELGSLK
jgi:purine-binding chemotaxis protein CheW